MPWLKEHAPQIDWKKCRLIFNSDHCRFNCLEKGLPAVAHSQLHHKDHFDLPTPGLRVINGIEVCNVSAAQMFRYAANSNVRTAILAEEDFDMLEDTKNDGTEPSHERMGPFTATKAFGAKVSPEDYVKFKDKLFRDPPTKAQVLAKTPSCIHHLADTFNANLADKLPPHRPNLDYRIDLVPGSLPVKSRLRGMTRQEAEAVKLYVEDMLRKGHIRRSTSAFAASLLIARKPGGGIRICVDYRGLNEVTIKNRNAPPLIRDLLARISKAR